MNSALPIIVAIISALGGGAGLVAILKVRSENAKIRAEAFQIHAKAQDKTVDTLQGRYDKLFDDLQVEVSRLRTQELECRGTLEATIKSMGELRMVAINAQAAVTLLQDRLDKIETEDPGKRQNTVREVMRQMGLTEPGKHT